MSSHDVHEDGPKILGDRGPRRCSTRSDLGEMPGCDYSLSGLPVLRQNVVGERLTRLISGVDALALIIAIHVLATSLVMVVHSVANFRVRCDAQRANKDAHDHEAYQQLYHCVHPQL